ncbi:hypothetical protein VDR20_20935, partial [Xanthomonas campestris pv. campestris]|nr:hypothetical protein [Xanthomonas campestris]MEB1698298.1 hypothetical protein [Xanthomonas campestris pv. campestris]
PPSSVSNINRRPLALSGIELRGVDTELPKKIQFPAEHVFLAAVQILTPDELTYVAEKRAEGRNHLHGLMRSSGLYHFISPGRASLLKNDSVPAKKAWWNYFGKG